jgi:hypothetical protein
VGGDKFIAEALRSENKTKMKFFRALETRDGNLYLADRCSNGDESATLLPASHLFRDAKKRTLIF